MLLVVKAVGIASIDWLQSAAWSDSAMLLAQLRWLIGHLHNPNKLPSDEVLFFIVIFVIAVVLTFYFFEGHLDLWQSITPIRFGICHFLLRFLTVNIVMWLAGRVRLDHVPVQRAWYWLAVFEFLIDISVHSVSLCLKAHSPVQYPLEVLSLFIQLLHEVNLLLGTFKQIGSAGYIGLLFFFNLN